MPVDRNIRFFSIWEYSVSHSQLLVRSRTEEEEFDCNNIDLIFGGVSLIHAIDMTSGMFINISDVVYDNFVGTETDINLLRDLPNYEEVMSEKKLFVIRSGDRAWYVGAYYLRIERNKLGPMESNLDTHQIRDHDFRSPSI